MEYVRQGFPPTLNEIDPRNSSSLLPRPTGRFPMSITPLGRGQSHPPSRFSSKITLPQLGMRSVHISVCYYTCRMHDVTYIPNRSTCQLIFNLNFFNRFFTVNWSRTFRYPISHPPLTRQLCPSTSCYY